MPESTPGFRRNHAWSAIEYAPDATRYAPGFLPAATDCSMIRTDAEMADG